MEKHKIFISGLPFACTTEKLEELCKEHGTVKAVRLVTNRSGKPKVWVHASISIKIQWRYYGDYDLEMFRKFPASLIATRCAPTSTTSRIPKPGQVFYGSISTTNVIWGASVHVIISIISKMCVLFCRAWPMWSLRTRRRRLRPC